VDQYLLLNLFLIICDEICGCVPLKHKGFFICFQLALLMMVCLILVLKKACHYTTVAACQQLLLSALNFTHGTVTVRTGG